MHVVLACFGSLGATYSVDHGRRISPLTAFSSHLLLTLSSATSICTPVFFGDGGSLLDGLLACAVYDVVLRGYFPATSSLSFTSAPGPFGAEREPRLAMAASAVVGSTVAQWRRTACAGTLMYRVSIDASSLVRFTRARAERSPPQLARRSYGITGRSQRGKCDTRRPRSSP